LTTDCADEHRWERARAGLFPKPAPLIGHSPSPGATFPGSADLSAIASATAEATAEARLAPLMPFLLFLHLPTPPQDRCRDVFQPAVWKLNQG
jgi:hypothetical protein